MEEDVNSSIAMLSFHDLWELLLKSDYYFIFAKFLIA